MSVKREHNGVLNHDHDSKNGVNGHDQVDGIQEPPFKKLKIAIETLPERKVEFYGDDLCWTLRWRAAEQSFRFAHLQQLFDSGWMAHVR